MHDQIWIGCRINHQILHPSSVSKTKLNFFSCFLFYFISFFLFIVLFFINLFIFCPGGCVRQWCSARHYFRSSTVLDKGWNWRCSFFHKATTCHITRRVWTLKRPYYVCSPSTKGFTRKFFCTVYHRLLRYCWHLVPSPTKRGSGPKLKPGQVNI